MSVRTGQPQLSAEPARPGPAGSHSGDHELFALAAVTVGWVIAAIRTTALAALANALVVAFACWTVPYESHAAASLRLPWPPHVIAATGMVTLAGLLCMIAAFRSLSDARSTCLRTRLATIAAHQGATHRLSGRILVAVGAGGAGATLTASGVRHSWDGRYPLPAAAVAALALVIALVWGLLRSMAARRLMDRGATPFLAPALLAAAGVVLPPLAIPRLWSTWDYDYDGISLEIAWPLVWFDPEGGGLGVLAGCLLMFSAGFALVALRGASVVRQESAAREPRETD